MMCPCCLNHLLSMHKASKGTFLFDTTPMAPLGTEVLVHQKLSQSKTWSYHAAKAWHLSHAATHYCYICVIMKAMGVNASQTHLAINIMQSLSWS
jgi:hypothetical protein